MQYALLAQAPGKQPRVCAIFPASDLPAAIQKGQDIHHAGLLHFVEKRSNFSTRLASRRETQLMADFFSANNKSATGHMREDELDLLLSRRRDLAMVFFVGLYTAPGQLQEWIKNRNPSSTSPGGSTSTGGSGGIETSPPQVSAGEPAAEDSQTSDTTAEQSRAPNDAENNNISADDDTMSILDQLTSSSGAEDSPIDLGDEEIL